MELPDITLSDFDLGEIHLAFDSADQRPPPQRKTNRPDDENADMRPPEEVTGFRAPDAVKVRKQREYHYDLRTAGIAASTLSLPEPDESLHCVMDGRFHAFDVIIALQKLAGCPIRSLTVSTLGFNRHNLSHLRKMHGKGLLTEAFLLCSDYQAGIDERLVEFARETLRDFGTIRSARNHSKIACLDMEDGRAFVTEGSANLRTCSNIEQFTIFQSRQLLDFHSGWIRSVTHG